MKSPSVATWGAVGLLFGGTLVLWRAWASYLETPLDATDTRVTIVDLSANASARDFVALLSHNGLIDRPAWLLWYLEYARKSFVTEEGEYALSRSLAPAQMVDRVTDGVRVTHTVTVAPGLSAASIIAMLVDKGLGETEALSRALVDVGLIKRARVTGPSFDGYLFPDVYSFTKQDSPETILSTMTARFWDRIQQAGLDRVAEGDPLGMHGVITAASLIESARVPDAEKPMLSAIIRNRIHRGEPLSSVASLRAPLVGRPSSQANARLGDPKEDHAELRGRLPRVPVSNPGLTSIRAAFFPALSDALFFVPYPDRAFEYCPDEECFRIRMEEKMKEQSARNAFP